MKILFINSVYKEKSTGNLMASIEQFCKEKGHQTLVIYGRGEKRENAIRIQNKPSFLTNVLFSRISGKTWDCFAKKQTKKIINIIEEFKPDIINIHQLYGFYLNPSRLLWYIKQKGIKTIITLHDFTMLTGKCGYPLSCEGFLTGCGNCPRKREYPKSYFFDKTKQEFAKKRDLFNNAPNISFVAVSKWLEQMARLSPITNKSEIFQIDNGIETGVFRFNHGNEDDGFKNIVVVSTNFKDKIKGGDFLVNVINETSLISDKIRFILIGRNAEDIQEKVKNKKMVLSLGKCDKKEISRWYGLSVCSFVPSQSETFSLPTVESLCSGVPVFGPKGCGAPEFLMNHRLCNFKSNRDPRQMARTLLEFCSSEIDENELKELSELAIKKFEISNMTNQYLNLFERATHDEKK